MLYTKRRCKFQDASLKFPTARLKTLVASAGIPQHVGMGPAGQPLE